MQTAVALYVPDGRGRLAAFLPSKSWRLTASTVTVPDQVQVVIPAAIRRRLDLVPGGKLDFELEGDSIRARPLKSIPSSRAAAVGTGRQND